MHRSILYSVGFTLALSLGACSSPPEPKAKKDPQGREETRTIRNTEAVGYAGNAIANKVDQALDTNDQAKQRMDEELDAQENGGSDDSGE